MSAFSGVGDTVPLISGRVVPSTSVCPIPHCPCSPPSSLPWISLQCALKILSGDRGGDHLGVMGKALSVGRTVETNKMVIKSTFLSDDPRKNSSAELFTRISNCCNAS